MENNGKVIFTVTEPDDLYIIGDFPWDKAGVIEKEINERFGDRYVQITDDYSTIYIKGKAKTDFTIGCETAGTFILLTKKEWLQVRQFFMESEEFSFMGLHDEEYAIVIRKYVGDVGIDLLDEDCNSYLPKFDQTKSIGEQRVIDEETEDRVSLWEVVTLESGFMAKPIYLQELYGYSIKTTTDRKVVFLDDDTGEEHICTFNESIGKKWTEMGEQKIITTKWVKNETDDDIKC